MYNNNIYHFFIVTIVFLSIVCSEANIPSYNQKDWGILQNDKIWIGWKHHDKLDWCRAESVILAPIEEVREIIEDKKNYPQIFKRIEKTEIITDEIVYIALDMPFPFNGRDYIVSYTQLQEENDIIYRFNAVKDSEMPVHEDYVRLIHAAGEWRLHPLDDNNTEVTYTWNGELLGDFPDWALRRAWKTQGQEVMTWLKESIE